jgi:hypothetical protein
MEKVFSVWELKRAIYTGGPALLHNQLEFTVLEFSYCHFACDSMSSNAFEKAYGRIHIGQGLLSFFPPFFFKKKRKKKKGKQKKRKKRKEKHKALDRVRLRFRIYVNIRGAS